MNKPPNLPPRPQTIEEKTSSAVEEASPPAVDKPPSILPGHIIEGLIKLIDVNDKQLKLAEESKDERLKRVTKEDRDRELRKIFYLALVIISALIQIFAANKGIRLIP